MNPHRHLWPLLLCTALLLPSAPALAAPLQVQDDAGATLTLAQPARRIVSLAPHLTELLFAAGAGAQVVGVGAYSDYPVAAKALPQVGDSAMLDLERIVALKPDLLVVWRDGNAPPQLQRLAALGIPIYASRLDALADIASTLRRLGQLAGSDAVAQARARGFEQDLDALRQRYAGRPTLRVFYQIWHRPLMTVNGRHLVSEALRLCGAQNVFSALTPLVPTVSEEAVVAADPDAIVSGSVDPQGREDLATWRALKTLRATRQQGLIVVNPDTLNRSSDRIVLGVRELCTKLDAVREHRQP